EAGNIQRALIQQTEVGSAIGRIVSLARYELVDATGGAVIAHVERQTVGIVLHERCVLVRETAHGGALGSGPELVERIDFRHPSVAVLGLRRVQVVVGGLFTGQVCAPGRTAAGAVVQRTHDAAAHHGCGRAGDIEHRVAGV